MQDETQRTFCLLLAQHYKERDPNTLWRCITSQTMGVNRVLRSKSAKRIGTALTEVLRERGFDGHGRRLPDHIPDLRGSLEIFIFKTSINMDFEVAKKELRRVVDFVIHQNKLSRTSHHRPGMSSPEFRRHP
jgi:hypothetical protein